MDDIAASPEPLDAVASDPVALGWMQGAPPPRDKQVRFDDLSMYAFPQLRWSFSNIAQLLPTTVVSRGDGPVCALPRADRQDLDHVVFTPLDRSGPMSWVDSLAANYTDAIVVLHRGRIVHERYFGASGAATPHIVWSVTKSFYGLIAAALVIEGRLDPQAPVTDYVPEMAASGLGSATVRQVLDMTTCIDYSEDYADPQAGVLQHGRAGGMAPRAPGDAGPASFCEFLVTLRAAGPHGRAFSYSTVNTDLLGWILRRATGQRLNQLLSERVWAALGCEQDGRLTVDATGTEFAGGGLNVCLRDLARFGEMMRNGGRFNGRQVVPEAAIAGIRGGADRADFARADYPLLPGWSYRDMWWVTHNAHAAYCARGIHGQGLYIDPAAEMVIARFASHPMASNADLDPTTLPAYHALALHLIATG